MVSYVQPLYSLITPDGSTVISTVDGTNTQLDVSSMPTDAITNQEQSMKSFAFGNSGALTLSSSPMYVSFSVSVNNKSSDIDYNTTTRIFTLSKGKIYDIYAELPYALTLGNPALYIAGTNLTVNASVSTIVTLSGTVRLVGLVKTSSTLTPTLRIEASGSAGLTISNGIIKILEA